MDICGIIKGMYDSEPEIRYDLNLFLKDCAAFLVAALFFYFVWGDAGINALMRIIFTVLLLFFVTWLTLALMYFNDDDYFE